jgi:L-threonylcarbamoyladenylate synthase
VGVRVPDHDGCRALIRAAGGALAVTSANRSGEVSPTTVAAAAAQLGDAVTLYLDGGRTVGGTPSTVVSLHDDTFTIIRKGPIPAAMIANVLSS